MIELNRRSFLAGIFGAAAVAAAGPMPKLLEQLPEQEFIKAATAAVAPGQRDPPLTNDELLAIYDYGKGY